jgi:hypothetical protein
MMQGKGKLFMKNQGQGFFTVAKFGDRWGFADPAGQPFISIGLNHIDDSDLRYPHNRDIFQKKYQNRENWIKGVLKDLKYLNFNTLGWTQQYISGDWGAALDWFGDPIDLGHSYPWSHSELKNSGMPYVVQIRVQEIEDWNGHPAFRDVYSSDFEKYADWIARTMCSEHADSPNLIGYFLVDIPAWFPHAAKRFFPSFEGLSPAEHDKKLYDVASKYYETIVSAIKRYDPNHLILGDRYNGNKGIPDAPLRAMRDYVDVLSVQYFAGSTVKDRVDMVESLGLWHEMTGKPIVIADTGNWCATEMNPHRTNALTTQEERGHDYAELLAKLTEQPWLIGSHWCSYLENVGRGWGIKDPYDEFYTDFSDQIVKANLSSIKIFEKAAGK